jgi:sugar phosphate isomerase/epimerase
VGEHGADASGTSDASDEDVRDVLDVRDLPLRCGRGEMRIGLSLPPAYLVGDASRGSAAVWRDTFGNAEGFLSVVREAGVSSIEVRSIAEDADPSLALRAARRAWEAGLGLTVHGRLPRQMAGTTLGEVYPALVPLVEALGARGERAILTLHCYSEQGGVARQLAERTSRALGSLLELFQREGAPLSIALEINHVGPHVDPGITYAGIVEMIAGTGRLGIGACWDMGHAFMNVQHGRLARDPSAAFLERVIHTHVHDLGPRTHHPLTHGVVPVDHYVGLLFAHGYEGILNLELSPERYPESVWEGLWSSIERLVALGQGGAADGTLPTRRRQDKGDAEDA